MKAIVIPQYTQRLMVGTFVAASFFATTVQANATIQQPELDNSAFILIDYDTGTVLAQKNAAQPFPPASLTKMMTSYIIEQRLLSGALKENEPVLMTPEVV